MTGIDLQTSTGTANETETDTDRRKSILFCPVCGHEIPIDSNWDVTSDGNHRKCTCPECGQTVASR